MRKTYEDNVKIGRPHYSRFSFRSAELTQAPPEVVSAITATVNQYNLGNPRAESPNPNQTPLPRNQGYWQAFEPGWVYWSPTTRAHMVIGDIFAKWGALGWEQGQLGFPTSDELACAPFAQLDTRDRFQRFEYGVIHWRAATRETIVYRSPARFGENNVCLPVAEPVRHKPMTELRWQLANPFGIRVDGNPASGMRAGLRT